MPIEKFRDIIPSNEFSETDEKVETLKEIVPQITKLQEVLATQKYISVHRRDAAEKLFQALTAIVKDEIKICQESEYKGFNQLIELRIAEAERIIEWDTATERNKTKL